MFTIAKELYKLVRTHIRDCDNDNCCLKRLVEKLELE
jgi:hypothetical protein